MDEFIEGTVLPAFLKEKKAIEAKYTAMPPITARVPKVISGYDCHCCHVACPTASGTSSAGKKLAFVMTL
eukprot:2536896-Rhodomonas_salina.1